MRRKQETEKVREKKKEKANDLGTWKKNDT